MSFPLGAWALTIVYTLWQQIQIMAKKRRDYGRTFTEKAELLNLIGALITIVFYVLKVQATIRTVEKFHNNRGKPTK